MSAHQSQASQVTGSGGLFKNKGRRALYLFGAGAVAMGLLGLGIRDVINEPPLDDKPVDTGSSSISQVTTSPPDVPKPVTAPNPMQPNLPPPVKVDAPAPPAVIMAASNPFVRFPKGSGETSFDVAPPPPREDAPSAAELAQRAAAKTAALDASETHVAFKPSVIIGGKAGKAMHLDYVMMPQNVLCILDTAMDSTLAGSIICHLAHDIQSPSHIPLMYAGDKVVGTYKNDVKNGQTRIFAFAGSAITAEGIPVPLDSQMGDGYGRNGVPGQVDNHNPERFGASIALTAAQSAVSIATAALSSGGNSYFNLNQGSGGGPQELASEILHKQIEIQPTITVPPGSVISIIVDHAIDFSDAIKVRTRE